MEEMGFAEPAQDLWDSRRTLPIFGTTRTSLLTRYGMKPWDSQLHANSKYFFQPCKPTKTLNAVVRTDLPLSWKREGFVFNLRRYGMPVIYLCRLISTEKRQEFKSPEGCQMFSTLVKTDETLCAKLVKTFSGYKPKTNPVR